MNHPFEIWLKELKLKQAEQVPFDEAFICYRVGANRAALLFSYIGFLTILKHRVIKAKRPNEFEVQHWLKQILYPLKNEMAWESSIFDLTQNKGKGQKPPIFNISDDLRDQIKYWKDRRNDCAHYKDNLIESYHVESFWAFVKSNLNKITVEGGINNLLKKFEEFFDETKTPSDASIEPLIKEIPQVVEGKDYEEFWKKVFDRGNEFNSYYLEEAGYIADSIFIYLSGQIIVESLVVFLKSNTEFDEVWFVKNYPQHINLFNFSKEEIRELWKVKVHEDYPEAPLGLLTYMIRNSIIPEAEIEEAIELFIDKGWHEAPTEPDIIELDKYNFRNKVRKEVNVWMSKGFEFINSKAGLIVTLLHEDFMDKDLVELICQNQLQSYPSFTLRDKIETLFRNKRDIYKEFKRIASDNSISLPKRFQNIQNEAL